MTPELEHRLRPYFAALSRFDSMRELEASPVYRFLRPDLDALLARVFQENFGVLRQSAPAGETAAGERAPQNDAPKVTGQGPAADGRSVRVAAWNVERGLEQAGIIEALKQHPVLASCDVLLLTELDYGMARTGNRFVAREIARSLKLNFAFAPSYINLNKGSGLESLVGGENQQALHGNALFSRWPLRRVRSIPLPNGKDKMQGKEKRLGCQRAVAAVIEHPLGSFQAVSVHLDAHSSQRHRAVQMECILNDLDGPDGELPAIIGGDWNTSTYDSRNAFVSIAGYARRVLMGIQYVLQNHYPYPERWFERHLFQLLERRGFRYREFNVPGGCTLHYDVRDLAANGRMADWIPQWCFWFIQWALRKNAGRCSMKLDWFAARDFLADPRNPARVVSDIHPPGRLLSDHDPIIVDALPVRGQSET